MALSSSCLIELKIHRDLLEALNQRLDVESALPEEIKTVLSDVATFVSIPHLPIPVACGSYVEDSFLVMPIFIGCPSAEFAEVGGLDGIAMAIQMHFKMYFYEILQGTGQQHLASSCSVRVGCDCLQL